MFGFASVSHKRAFVISPSVFCEAPFFLPAHLRFCVNSSYTYRDSALPAFFFYAPPTATPPAISPFFSVSKKGRALKMEFEETQLGRGRDASHARTHLRYGDLIVHPEQI